MPSYRCYILDSEEHILQAHDLDCESDADAASSAEALLSHDPYHRSVEVWKSTRRVAKVEREAGRNLRLSRQAPRPVRPVSTTA